MVAGLLAVGALLWVLLRRRPRHLDLTTLHQPAATPEPVATDAVLTSSGRGTR